MHHDEIAFCQRMIDFPEDDAPALMYADWLAERGIVWMARALRSAVEQGKRPETGMYDSSPDTYYWPVMTNSGFGLTHTTEIGYGSGVEGYHRALRRLARSVEFDEEEREESRRQREAMQDLPF